jgi:manganese transport protein
MRRQETIASEERLDWCGIRAPVLHIHMADEGRVRGSVRHALHAVEHPQFIRGRLRVFHAGHRTPAPNPVDGMQWRGTMSVQARAAAGTITLAPGRRYAGETITGQLDTGTITAGTAILTGTSTRRGLARLLPFLGPAFIASVAYVDPGNFGTNIQAGAQFGYLLVWVIIAANVLTMFIQGLSAKLGIATGLNLAEAIRAHFPPVVTWCLWAIEELVAMAIDLAEFLGAAIGLNILFHIPLFPAGLLTGVICFLILALQQYGFRPIEAIITALVGTIALCYVVETFMGQPSPRSILSSFSPPRFAGTDSIVLAVGILGATVMPHVVYLHSALTQDRIATDETTRKRTLFRFTMLDIFVAMPIAGFVNAAMLIMAAATFWANGHGAAVANADNLITEAYQTLTPLLGSVAAIVFGVSLLASGISSSTVGTMAGQVIMQGFLHRRVPLWLRRAVMMVPALVVIALNVNPTKALVYTQVGVSFGLPFALIPLVIFTQRGALMGVLVNRKVTTVLAWAMIAAIVALNGFLLYQTIPLLVGIDS